MAAPTAGATGHGPRSGPARAILWHSAMVTGSATSWQSAGGGEVPLRKSPDVLGTASRRGNVPPAPTFRLKERGADCSHWTPPLGPSSTSSHQLTRHTRRELNRKAHVFPSLARACRLQGSQRARVKAKTAMSLGAHDHSLGWSPALLLAEDEVAVGQESRDRGHSGDTEQTLVRKRE